MSNILFERKKIICIYFIFIVFLHKKNIHIVLLM